MPARLLWLLGASKFKLGVLLFSHSVTAAAAAVLRPPLPTCVCTRGPPVHWLQARGRLLPATFRKMPAFCCNLLSREPASPTPRALYPSRAAKRPWLFTCWQRWAAVLCTCEVQYIQCTKTQANYRSSGSEAAWKHARSIAHWAPPSGRAIAFQACSLVCTCQGPLGRRFTATLRAMALGPPTVCRLPTFWTHPSTAFQGMLAHRSPLASTSTCPADLFSHGEYLPVRQALTVGLLSHCLHVTRGPRLPLQPTEHDIYIHLNMYKYKA
jgi:hypothetical protein